MRSDEQEMRELADRKFACFHYIRHFVKSFFWQGYNPSNKAHLKGNVSLDTLICHQRWAERYNSGGGGG